MDRQNVKPNRPSLLANGDTRAADRAPEAGRILTDVEQGTSRGAAARAARRRPVLLIVGAVVVLGAFLAWGAFDKLPRPSVVAETPLPASSSPSRTLPDAADARAVEPASASRAASDTATIVDAGNPFGGSSTPRATDPNPFGETTGSQRPIKRPNPFATAHASAKRPDSAGKHVPAKRVVPLAEAKAATHKRTSAKTAPSTPAKTETGANETALGNSLLGNIDPDGLVARVTPVPSAPVSSSAASRTASSTPMGSADGATRPESKLIRPQTGADHEALDSLIQQVDALQSEAGTAAGANASANTVAPGKSSSRTKKTTAHVNQIDGNKPLTRTEKLQRDLRRCPQANTTSGVDCRIEVCRSYGGKDPACAMKH